MMDPRHRRIAEIALAAAGSNHGLALAAGYAVRAHGIGELFKQWRHELLAS